MSLFDIEYIWMFLVALPLVSFIYSAIGHGGASGYLAMMTLFGFAPDEMKPTALLLNLFVAAISFYQYRKAGHFNKKLFLSFAVASVPFAFLGGVIELEVLLYKRILGVLLVFAVLRMLNVFGQERNVVRGVKAWQGLICGALIGFFSGLIGIGGGIILSPVILLMGWGKIKEAAAVSALFIWVNSASGIIGQITTGFIIQPQSYILVGLALTGGFLGAYFGSRKLNSRYLRYLLTLVLLLACIKLLFV